jgi:flagellar hook protein FlgE
VQGYPSDGAGGIDTNAAPTDISIPAIASDTSANPLKSYNIGSDGVITGVYADGTKTPLFQVALANFANPPGLDKVGDTAFRASTNSGLPQVGAPGTGRLGKLMTGVIEMSNVDLASEFTNLIIAQRGFQATSRVITTSDEVLDDLVNIKR